MKLLLIKYWFEFEIDNAFIYPAGIGIGCGVTAFDYDDACSLIKMYVFNNQIVPNIKLVIENIDIRKLDQGHVIPNMKSPNIRGVWFPFI